MSPRTLFPVFTALLASAGIVQAADAPAPAAPSSPAPVTITENATSFTMDNGLVTARVSKATGDLTSLVYKDTEMLGAGSGHPFGYWSHDARSPRTVARVTVDPKSNNGAVAEVSVKGHSDGQRLGTGPGAAEGGDFAADIDIRYAMVPGVAGVYTFCEFDHLPSYPAATITEARYCVKLHDMFDWMLVDATPHRNKLYPTNSRENKYFYTTVQFDNRAFGWASTAKNFGVFIMNPSMEYMSGGPTKVEFLCHRDTTAVAAPAILNYWRSSHYGGASVSVAEGEHWKKVIGPFLVYVNSGSSPEAMFQDALAMQKKEEAKWPYAWVEGSIDYLKKEQRGAVSGQLVLNDPFVPGAKFSRARIGLTFPDRPPAAPGQRGQTWQTDAKHYQFWVYADDNGKFTIPNVRPGTYEFHAIADGVLGEYKKADVTVAAGQTLDLGKVEWQPVHYGKVLWEIGTPNRNPTEFFKGDDYFHNGMDVAYAEFFPNDVRYVVGKSDPKKDWYYMHIPRASAEAVAAAAARRGGAAPAAAPAPAVVPAPVAAPAGGGAPSGGAPGAAPRAGGPARGPAPAPGTATPWTIEFDMAKAGQGTAVLRIALARTALGANGSIAVGVNGEPVTAFRGLASDGSLGGTGVGIQGIWREYAVSLDASKFKQGTNTITLTVPAGALSSGVCYDYVNLELNESAPFPQAAAQ